MNGKVIREKDGLQETVYTWAEFEAVFELPEIKTEEGLERINELLRPSDENYNRYVDGYSPEGCTVVTVW